MCELFDFRVGSGKKLHHTQALDGWCDWKVPSVL